MKTSEKVLLSAAVAAFLTMICWMFFTVTKPEPQPQPVVGSVDIGNSYHSTTTDTQAVFANYRVIREGTDWTNTATTAAGVLGSIVITAPGTSEMNFYDATTTKTNGEWATTTLAHFVASSTAGTYTFDIGFRKGLLIEFTGGPGTTRASTTISYRLNATP